MGLIQPPPISWKSMSSCSGCWFWILHFSYLSFLMEGTKPPLYRWWGSLFWWVGAFCAREVDRHCHSSWHGGYLPISLPPFLFGLAYCDPVPWLVSFLLGFIICQHQWASTLFLLPYVCVPSSHYLRSSPVLSGCSSRCPQQKPQCPIFPPQRSFTGRSLGDCLTTFLLWHPLSFTSCRGSLAWERAGTPVPCMMAAHTQGNPNIWCN